MTVDPDHEIARALRLRVRPAPVVRLSRPMVAAAAGVAALAVGGLVVWSTRPHAGGLEDAGEVVTPVVEARPPERLTALPRDYSELPPGVPRLGPPLPGDLGRPILAARDERDGQVAQADPVRQARDDETRQGLVSRIFAATAPRASADGAAGGGPRPVAGEGVGPPPAPPALWRLPAGVSLKAALLTGIRSDLPGPVIAQVSEDVVDAEAGRVVLVPRGARVVGAYDSRVAFGQSRVLVTWTSLVMPDGRSVELGEAPAVDGAGATGLQDRVDRHWRRLIGASLVSLGLAAAGQVGRRSEADEISEALRRGLADTAAGAGGEVVGRSLSVAPTLTVRAGFPVRVLLVRPLSLPAWSGG